MTQATLTEIRGALLNIYFDLHTVSDEDILHGRDAGLRPCFSRLDRLAALEVNPEVLEKILQSSELTPVLSLISRLRNIYGLRLEIEQAHALLASPDPWREIRKFTFYKNYLQLSTMEQQGAGLKPGDRIIFLGSGPLPLSLILLCSQYGLKGIGIERETSSVELSRKVVEHLELEHQISIISGDHFFLPLKEETQLLMVAAMARPKKAIFRHLAQILPTGSLVSYRLYEKGLRRLLDQEEEAFVPPPEFSAYCRMRPQPPVNNTVVVVKKITQHKTVPWAVSLLTPENQTH